MTLPSVRSIWKSNIIIIHGLQISRDIQDTSSILKIVRNFEFIHRLRYFCVSVSNLTYICLSTMCQNKSAQMFVT